MNKCLLIHNICLVLAMAPIVSHATDAAETVSPGGGRPNGGDYSIPAPSCVAEQPASPQVWHPDAATTR